MPYVAVIIVVAVVSTVFGIVGLVSFFSGDIKFGDLVSGIQGINPIPRVSDLNGPLLILGGGSLMIGLATLLAAKEGKPLPPIPPPPSLSVSNPTLGSISVGPGYAGGGGGGRSRGRP